MAKDRAKDQGKKDRDALAFLALVDAFGRPFFVPAREYPFAERDAERRKPVEGMEEDGQSGTPASHARRELVSALRDQAIAIAIAGTTVTMQEARIAASVAARAARPVDADRAAAQAVAQLVKNDTGRTTLAEAPKVPPLDTAWAHRFNTATAGEIDTVRVAREMNRNTRDAVRGAATVEEVMLSPAFSAGRASTIIRTETARAQQEAVLADIQAGVATPTPGIPKKKWTVSPGACPVCQALDGQVLAADVEFWAGPYFGYIQTPPAHPNCRCSIEAS